MIAVASSCHRRQLIAGSAVACICSVAFAYWARSRSGRSLPDRHSQSQSQLHAPAAGSVAFGPRLNPSPVPFVRWFPVSVHNWVRDSGAFALVADAGAVVAGLFCMLLKPSLAALFFRREGRVYDVSYGSAPRQRLDVFVPTVAASAGTEGSDRCRSGLRMPVLLFVHGGAWGSGNKFLYRLVGECFRGAGFVTVVANYRLYPEARTSDDQVRDIEAAVLWASRHAVRYGGDPQRLFLAGHSSGTAYSAHHAHHSRAPWQVVQLSLACLLVRDRWSKTQLVDARI